MISRHLVALLAAGAAVLALLAAPMASWAAPASADDGREIGCLALTIYYEARGESERGKLAVGHVVMNRTRSVLFPASVCEVVRQGGQQRDRCQFSWWCDGRSDRPKDQAALRESLRLAEGIYYGCTRDPTAGALWYHSTGVKPSWSKSFRRGKRIDRHVFYRGDSDRPVRMTASATSRDRCPRVAPARTTTLLAGS
ncbi:MAG: cell wall hydrolase [Rhodospirillales bacterium]|nr:cell wall hydrolase [Rhodospirillales bacterium]